jgi:hypothetical protein
LRLRTSMPTASPARRHAARSRCLCRCAAHEFRQQFRRQVVDAVVVQVLEGVQRDRLAAAGHAADDDRLESWWAGSARHAFSAMLHSSFARVPGNAVAGHERRRRIDALDAQDVQRVAASVSTARLRPAITGRVIIGTSRSSTRRRCRGRRSGARSRRAGLPVGCGRLRCTIRRRYLFRLTAVSPNIWRTLSTPRPRTSSRSCSRSGQVPSSTSGAIWVNSGASSATRRWPRVTVPAPVRSCRSRTRR